LPDGSEVFHLNAPETDFLYREIFERRGYLRGGVTLQDGDCVFDVGANIGLFTLFAGRQAADVTVYAFEPIPPVFQVLRGNTELHGVDARLFDCALSSRAGTETFTYYPHASVLSGRLGDEAQEREVVKSFLRNQLAENGDDGGLDELLDLRLASERFIRPVSTLSDVIREQGVTRIDLLKVDVEKSEEDVLLGLGEADWARVGQVVVEVHDTGGRLARVRDLLARHGFHSATEQDEALNGTALYNVYAVRPGWRDGRAAAAPRAEVPARWTDRAHLLAELREHAAARLPEYMVPSAVVLLQSLPLTPNGKLDRAALPAPDAAGAGGEADDGYVAPRTPVEEMLAAIWCEVLEVRRVGMQDSFFELGGHSLLATLVMARIREVFGVAMPLRALFDGPSVAELADRLEALLRVDLPVLPPVVPVPRTAEMPLSFGQERLWFLQRLQPESTSYNHPWGLRLRGPLDVPRLERVLAELVRRHEPLRTTFPERDGLPVQRIEPFTGFSLAIDEVAGLPGTEREAEAVRRMRAEGALPFDLAAGPLFRARLLRLAPDDHMLLLRMHHIVTDGWSLGVMCGEMAALYEAYGDGRESPLAEPVLQYADYAVWQRQHLRGEVLERQVAWWREHLAGAPALLELPTDRPRPAVQTYRGANISFRLPGDLLERLDALALREGVTLYMLLLGAWQVLLGRYAGSDDVVVGSPAAGRTRRELEGLVGFFVSTLVLRTDLSGGPDFREVLRRVRRTTLGAYEHQDAPFESLVEELQPERSLGHNPLFQVFFALQNLAADQQPLPGVRASSVSSDATTAKFDLALFLARRDDGLEGAMEYATDLFDRATVVRMAQHLEVLLNAVAADPARPVAALPLATAAEREVLVRGWSGAGERFPVSGTLHGRFEARAAARPDDVALTHGGESLTYAALNARADGLARRLRALGVGPEARVGLCAERSAGLVAGILAILKAGGAYVPLDPAYPPERLAYMARDAGIRVLLAGPGLEDRVPGGEVAVVALDGPAEEGAAPDAAPAAADPASLAYVIYTSGSTGLPKGVGVTHANVLRLFQATHPAFGFGAEDVWTLFHSCAFDFSVWELWGALLFGGRLVVVPWEVSRDPAAFRALLAGERVTVLSQTPSAFRALARADAQCAEPLDALRTVVFGGEALQYESLRGWLDRYGPARPRLVNMYGITETTVHVTWHAVTGAELREARAGSGVGVPLPDLRAYVLDTAGNPLPAGIPGELHVGGAGLARGYLGRPGLTAERFVPDPFGGEPGARLYRSGDRARWREERADVRPGSADSRTDAPAHSRTAVLEYLGRIDQQVKVRGFRIEPGEVESVLLAQPGVSAAAVVVRGGGEDAALVAYVVAADGAAPVPAALRDTLRRLLPEYMVPGAVVVLDRLPLTANGKLDRAALPAPDAAGAAPGDGYLAPRTPVEEVLAGIWCEVLGVRRVGAEDDFFELGGHSLRATQAAARIRDAFGVELPLRTLFEAPTVAALAERVEALRRAETAVLPPVVPLERTGPLPLSFGQERLWFLHRMEPESTFYNHPWAVRLDGPLHARALERALGEIVCRHGALRTVFPEHDGGPVQVVTPFTGFALPVDDLSGLDADARAAEAERAAAREAARPFDLLRGPVFRARLLRLGAEEHVLLVCMHHVVTDGWSLGIWFRELSALYAAYREGGESPLAELPVQYADYAAWQREHLRGEAMDRRLAWWTERLAGAPALLELPTDRPRRAVQRYRGARTGVAYPPALLDRLQALARAEGATLYMVLLAAFQVLLGRYAGSDDVVVGTPIAGRTRRETEGLIGFFVNTLVLRTDLSGDPAFREVLRRVRETTLGAYEHQDVPFERLVEALQPERSLSHSALFQVMFLLQNTDDAADALPGLRSRAADVALDSAKFDLSLAFAAGPEGLQGGLEYSTDLFDRGTAERMLGHLGRVLEQVVDDPDRPLSRIALLDPAERHAVLREWNRTEAAYPADRCIHQLFQAQAARTPDAVAVVSAGGSLTYGELDDRANRLARHLVRLGVGPEVRVGLCMERGLELMVAILGVMKAGGAYVPVDSAHPAERNGYVLADSAVAVLLTQERLRAGLPVADGVRVVAIDREWERIAEEDAGAPETGVTAENLAYVIYTSGSTGRPKGVAMHHRGVCNYIDWGIRAYGADRGSGAPVFSSMAVDLTITNLLPLFAGLPVRMLPEEAPVEALADALREGPGFGLIKITPTHLSLLTPLLTPEEARRAARTLVVGADFLPAEPTVFWQDHAPEVRLMNEYGPTETVVGCSAYVLPPWLHREGPVPVGGPIQNTRFYVLDAHGEPVPAGLPGELYIGGAGVARGYLGRPGLSAEKFVPDPFAEAGARMYRTGDRARWLQGGNLLILGRTDSQVKVHGFRVELGEIEAALRRHESVSGCLVTVREDVPGDRRLVAYVVGEAGTDALREHLRQRLPEYMVPGAFVRLDALPQTPTGKLDPRT
ncbi:MAG TPA: amino acid adenylation domain-containing protein, partial [Longimicrobium sp.]|nr:amino acid adenylation domain-containing protein [Longimicrobium sp.]